MSDRNIFDKPVAFYYDDIIGTFNYGSGHPMKPFRVAMTYELTKAYNMLPKLSLYVRILYRNGGYLINKA
jgi:hypothetical protein